MANARDRRAAWAVAILVLLVLFLVLNRCAGSSGSTRVGAVPNGDGPAEPAPAPTAPLEPGTDDADNDPDDDGDLDGDAGAGSGTLTVDGGPLGSDDLLQLTGRRAVADGALVLSVPADEGFWLDAGGSDRVWVQLTGRPPESPYTVLPGDRVYFTGRIVPNGSGFARRVGVTPAEGAGTLTAQRRHLNVAKRGLSLTHP
jgi:hypothetical protein